MPKAAPKKTKKADTPRKKNTGRPVRAQVQAARAAALRKLEAEEGKKTKQEVSVSVSSTDEPTSFSPRHVVVEVGDAAADEKATTGQIPEEQTSPVKEAIVEEAGSDASEEEKEEAPKKEQMTDTETLAAQNVAEAITTENPSEFAVVRKSVSSSRLFVAALVTGVLLGVVIFGGLILYQSYGGDVMKTFTKATPTPTKAPSSPTPTTVAFNPADYQIQILNGSGVAGAAGDVESILNDANFTNTTAGNASEFGFTDTEVALKKDAPKILFEKIKAALSDYSVVEVTALPSDGEYDAIITVGTTKNE